jgi:hypothetical protein
MTSRSRHVPPLIAPRVLAGLGATLLVVVFAVGEAGPPTKELPPPPAPDRGFYVHHVAPWIDQHCARCHRAEGSGSFLLAPEMPGQSEEARRQADFERVKPFVNREAPWESRLLRKVLDPACGGDPHVGGAFLRDDGDEAVTEHDVLLDFCSGATLSNLPPEVFLGKDLRAKPGDKVVVDGVDSFDRDRKDELRFHWDLYAVPPGSRTALDDIRASRVTFVPDQGGTYLLRLRVSDGKVWSAARAVAVEVFQQVVTEAPQPGGMSGLAAAEPAALKRTRRLYFDLLGRSPTPAEALSDSTIDVQQLATSLLLRAESGRAWWEEATMRLGLVDDLRPRGQAALDLPLTLVAERTPAPAAEAILVRDPAFRVAHPRGRAFATALTTLLLERPPTVEELAAAEKLAAGGPAEVPGFGTLADETAWLDAVIASEPFERAAVRRRLARLLSAGDAERQVGAGVLAARAGGKAWGAFLEGVVRSESAWGRKRLERKDDLSLMRGLFVDLLERKPTDRELLALVRVLRVIPEGPTPFAALVKVLVDSGQVPMPLLVDIPDAPKWITDRYLRYLGRPPSPEELTACGEVLLDAQGGPELVVYALLTGPEYLCR